MMMMMMMVDDGVLLPYRTSTRTVPYSSTVLIEWREGRG